MKHRGVFPGILLIGIGTYFLLRQLNFPFIEQAFTWPTLLLIIGLAFLAQGYSADHSSIFPGIVLTGLGIHFHAMNLFGFWPDHWAIYLLIVGIAFLLKYQKTKNGLVPGLLLFTIGILGLFYDGIIEWMGWIGKGVRWIEAFWPAALIILGIYILFFRKK